MALSTMLASRRRPCPVRLASASPDRMPTVAISAASGIEIVVAGGVAGPSARRSSNPA